MSVAIGMESIPIVESVCKIHRRQAPKKFMEVWRRKSAPKCGYSRTKSVRLSLSKLHGVRAGASFFVDRLYY
jgi:hypothetical protein